ncbi:lipoyl domain-containing protein [Bradyrhizobium sp. C-145]|uniref:lipoyl domain-containing protein n=1 Tax=Bradyrhizobium sp. C-145 TaxID=574727 RepID=UPI00201B5E47|nr:lipoyl domain-containing protein [Bradyrhizobium sp. C-145]UQR61452.1 lipoyl domain-containing protein [Bradyrhizobium sp. C-145]
MQTPVVLQTLGNDIEEAEVNEWLKSEGDWVTQGEVLILIATPKVSLEVEAPVTGRLVKICASAGELAAVGSTLGIIES